MRQPTLSKFFERYIRTLLDEADKPDRALSRHEESDVEEDEELQSGAEYEEHS